MRRRTKTPVCRSGELAFDLPDYFLEETELPPQPGEAAPDWDLARYVMKRMPIHQSKVQGPKSEVKRQEPEDSSQEAGGRRQEAEAMEIPPFPSLTKGGGGGNLTEGGDECGSMSIDLQPAISNRAAEVGEPALGSVTDPAVEAVGPEVAEHSVRAQALDRGALEIVVFRMGGEAFGLEILRVQEILRMPAPVPMPQAPAHVRGVINLRGQVVPVLNLRTLLRLPERDGELRPYLLVAAAGGATFGVEIEGISRVVKIGRDDLEGFDGDFLGGRFLWGVAHREDLLIRLLDLEVLFREIALGR